MLTKSHTHKAGNDCDKKTLAQLMTTHKWIAIASNQKSREHQSYFSEGNEIIRITSLI